MPVYHINQHSGRVNECFNGREHCEHGSPEDHYVSYEEAREVYEYRQSVEGNNFKTLRKETINGIVRRKLEEKSDHRRSLTNKQRAVEEYSNVEEEIERSREHLETLRRELEDLETLLEDYEREGNAEEEVWETERAINAKQYELMQVEEELAKLSEDSIGKRSLVETYLNNPVELNRVLYSGDTPVFAVLQETSGDDYVLLFLLADGVERMKYAVLKVDLVSVDSYVGCRVPFGTLFDNAESFGIVEYVFGDDVGVSGSRTNGQVFKNTLLGESLPDFSQTFYEYVDGYRRSGVKCSSVTYSYGNPAVSLLVEDDCSEIHGIVS